MIKRKTYQHHLLKSIIILSILWSVSISKTNAQNPNPVEGYSVLQQAVSKTGGGVRMVEEGTNGDYFIEYVAFYNDTMSINSHYYQLVFNDLSDSISSFYSKFIKYNKDDEPMAEQIVYGYDGVSNYDLQEMQYSGGNLFIEFEILIRTDFQREFYVGDRKIEYGPTDFYSPLQGQIIVILDANTMEYKTHILVQSDGNIGLNSWQASEGYLYFRRSPVNLMTVGQDTFRVEHEDFDVQWVNIVKYDYSKEEVVWNQVVANKIPILAAQVHPQFLGLDIDERGRIFVSMVDLGNSFTLGNDTIPFTTATPRHGAVIVLNTEGEIVRSDIINGNAFVVDVKSIGENSYILIQAGSDFINYRGYNIGSESENVPSEIIVIKVDKDGEYVDHYNTLPGCYKLYNFIRINDLGQLQLFGKYSNLDNNYCDNTTTEGQELPYEHNGSILTLDTDLNVLSNILFSAESVSAIPLDKNLSSNGNLVVYGTPSLHIQWPYFDEEPFFFEGGEASSRSIILTKDKLVNVVEEMNFSIDVRLYPNPTIGEFRVLLQEPLFGQHTLQVYNMNGGLIKTIENHRDEWVDLQYQSSGTYIVKLISNTKVITEKIIKL